MASLLVSKETSDADKSIIQSAGNDLRLQLRAALACLTEAGLIERKDARSIEPRKPTPPAALAPVSVSAILVSHNSRTWLEQCLPSLQAQSAPLAEMILVDNASEDDTCDWIRAHFPEVHLIPLTTAVSLARAINAGISQAHGEYFLLLNPDVILHEDAVAHLLAIAIKDDRCAAVAAKLKFLGAPAFINGMGNFVGKLSWGTDIGLGHLDLGQFDSWEEVPSACFATAMIPAHAWAEIGPLDEGFPLYYEDTEWCYRARLMGYRIRAAPLAEALHAFSGHIPAGEAGCISPQKLAWVTYGRLRFASKLMTWGLRARFVGGYAIEDSLRLLGYGFTARWAHIRALMSGWWQFLRARAEIREQRSALMQRKKVDEREVFHLWANIPAPLMWQGMPLLTWDAVCHVYLPLILQGKTRPLPEFTASEAHTYPAYHKETWLVRARNMLRNEGFKRIVYNIAKTIQWRLMHL